jgi:hypothetical protein
MRRPLVIYDFATAPFWISLYMRTILFSFFISVDFIHALLGIISPPMRILVRQRKKSWRIEVFYSAKWAQSAGGLT